MKEKEQTSNEDINENKPKKKSIIITMLKVVGIVVVVMIAVIITISCTTSIFRSGNDQLKKPIIYLYPTQDTKVSVVLGNTKILTHTYPKYENSWDVIAKPTGDLIDLKTGRNLYSLYWEGKTKIKANMAEGFVIEGKDTIAFLEEKLAILGLTEREANEFIIYWLPELENNKYNFIRFQTMEEVNRNMPLTISPAPDTIIRVMMEFKALNEKMNVDEQILETPQRNGFTVVEWGGAEVQ